jgi:RNA-binding protein YlmH
MNIYQHFRPEEREFIDQVLHWKDFVDSSYTSKLTDFLDPREQHILTILSESIKYLIQMKGHAM